MALVAAACERPPVDSVVDAGRTDAGSRAVDVLTFVQDRPAVGGDWYEYEPSHHLLTPRNQSYVLRDLTTEPARYVAFKPTNYYDEATADSGRVTLAFRDWANGWQQERTITLSRNIKDEGPVCLDVFSLIERDCTGTDWHLLLRVYPVLVLDGLLTVNEPGIFLRSAAGMQGEDGLQVATAFGTTDLSTLPDPSTIAALADGAAAAWNDTTWDRASYAPNTPEKGFAIGQRVVGAGFTARDHVYLLMYTRSKLAKFMVLPVEDGNPAAGLRFRYATTTYEADGGSAGEPGQTLEVDVPLPGAGTRTWLNFELDGLVVTDAAALAGTGLHVPPREQLWDIGIERLSGGAVRLLISYSAAFLNYSAQPGKADVAFDDVLR